MYQHLLQGKSSSNKDNIYEKNVYPLIKKQKLPDLDGWLKTCQQLDIDRRFLLNLFAYDKTTKKFGCMKGASEYDKSADIIGRYVTRVKQMNENFAIKDKEAIKFEWVSAVTTSTNKSYNPNFEICNMLVHYAIFLCSYCLEGTEKCVYIPYMIQDIQDKIKYYKIAKECITLCKSYNNYVDQKEISKCEDIGNDFLDAFVQLIRGLQFVLVGEMMGRKNADDSRRNSAKFYITAIDELCHSKEKFSKFKNYKNICAFIDCVNQTLELHANLYMAFDIELKYPANEGDIANFAADNNDVLFDLLSSESSFNYLYKYSNAAYELKQKLKGDISSEIGKAFPNYLSQLEVLLNESRKQAEGQLTSWPVVDQPLKLDKQPIKADTPLVLPTVRIVAGTFVFVDNTPPPSSPPTGGSGGTTAAPMMHSQPPPTGGYQPTNLQPPNTYGSFINPMQQQPPQQPQFVQPQFVQPQQPQFIQQQPQFIQPQQPQFIQPPPMQQQYPGGCYPQQPPPLQQQQTQYYQQQPQQQQSLPPPGQYTPYQPQYQYQPPPPH